MLEQVFNLGRRVERHIPVAPVHLLDDGQGVRRRVQKVWVAEGDVSGAHRDELIYVCENSLLLHETEATTVHRRNRTVGAGMGTTARRFDVTRQAQLTV